MLRVFFRFLLSGTAAALTNVIVLYILTDWLGIWYLASAVLSFLVAVVVGFLLQKFWTFAHRPGGRTHRQFIVYLTWTTTSFFLNLIILYSLVEFIGLHYVLSQLVASALLAVGSLIVYSQLVFRTAPEVF